MKRNLIQITFLLTISLFLVACGSNSDKTASKGEEGNAKDAKNETITLKLASHNPEDHPSVQAVYDFAEKLSEKTNGRYEIDVYPANQLGDYTTVYEEIGRGTIDMGLISIPSILDSRLDIHWMPYLVEDYSQLEEVLGPDSYIYSKEKELNALQGVEFLGFNTNGLAGIGSAKEISNIAEIGEDKGVLLRTPPSDIYKLPMEDIGFRTVTIPLADLYTSLQTGATDAWEGGDASLNYFGYRDVIDYYYTTHDITNTDALFMNKELYDGLSEEDRNIIDELSNELMLNSFANAEESDNKYYQKMEEEGIKVIKLSEEEISRLANHVRKVTWPKFEDHLGIEIITELKKIYE